MGGNGRWMSTSASYKGEDRKEKTGRKTVQGGKPDLGGPANGKNLLLETE